ncbi:hypothetical protein [Actinocrispum wychmicini]|uniref:Uncharacterized protein n=1 Tax=Actinocrispum wychmicini TaxID=1213861 RepID=A0A4R2J4V7_9PSEU|nr:hypothetical protein [Actinocrispum wychmicini]TCO52322.1 hypothetical protein EV192_11253 [Actinocrispum wychmicini]
MNTDAGRYGHLSTVDLEDLLHRPGLSATDFRSVQAELSRRYATGHTRQAPPARSPAPPPPRPAFDSAADTGKNIVWTVLVLIAVAVVAIGVALYFAGQKSDPGSQQPSYGDTSPCYCADGVRTYPGTVR